MLEIKNLSKSFHGNKVLDHINLKIEKGDVVGGCFWWKNGRSFQKT